VTTELERHAERFERFRLRRLAAAFGQRHARAAAREQLGGRQATSRRSRDRDAFSIDLESQIPNPQSLSQLQCGQTEESEDDSDNHEARDHFRLAPANQLEVVVQRRHAKQPLAAGGSEVRDLENH
jgi:hypothetical protein